MNALVSRFCGNRPVKERLDIAATWNRLDEKIGHDKDAAMYRYGKVAVAFLAEMSKKGYKPLGRSARNGTAPIRRKQLRVVHDYGNGGSPV